MNNVMVQLDKRIPGQTSYRIHWYHEITLLKFNEILNKSLTIAIFLEDILLVVFSDN